MSTKQAADVSSAVQVAAALQRVWAVCMGTWHFEDITEGYDLLQSTVFITTRQQKWKIIWNKQQILYSWIVYQIKPMNTNCFI